MTTKLELGSLPGPIPRNEGLALAVILKNPALESRNIFETERFKLCKLPIGKTPPPGVSLAVVNIEKPRRGDTKAPEGRHQSPGGATPKPRRGDTKAPEGRHQSPGGATQYDSVAGCRRNGGSKAELSLTKLSGGD